MQAQTKINTTKFNLIAAGVTILFHGGLILICILYIFHTPIPPFPESGGGGGLGIEVNLGNSDFGLGDVQENIVMPGFDQQVVGKGSSDENLLTQNSDENNSINGTQNKKDDAVPINQNAIYKGNRNGNNQGTAGGHGDQGNPNGNPNSNSYTGNGTGNGTGGGTGGGNGTGYGPGNGPGSGPGNSTVNYKLEGRTIKTLPKPNYDSKEEGIVVVSIWVDKNGNVTKAIAGARGTTTTNAHLLKIATDAASKAKFAVKDDAPEEQKGTITYNFINLN
jgi:hypothetical protein